MHSAFPCTLGFPWGYVDIGSRLVSEALVLVAL